MFRYVGANREKLKRLFKSCEFSLQECYDALPKNSEAAGLYREAVHHIFPEPKLKEKISVDKPSHLVSDLYRSKPDTTGMKTSVDIVELEKMFSKQLELERESEIRIPNVTQIDKTLPKRVLDNRKKIENIHHEWEFCLTEVCVYLKCELKLAQY